MYIPIEGFWSYVQNGVGIPHKAKQGGHSPSSIPSLLLPLLILSVWRRRFLLTCDIGSNEGMARERAESGSRDRPELVLLTG